MVQIRVAFRVAPSSLPHDGYVQGICTSGRPPTSDYSALAFESQSPFSNFYVDTGIKRVLELDYNYYSYKDNTYKTFFLILIFDCFIFGGNHDLTTSRYRFNSQSKIYRTQFNSFFYNCSIYIGLDVKT